MPEKDTEIRHNVSANRFEAEVDGRMAVADYEVNDRTMTMTHTFVPPELRGRGLAEKLVLTALEHARSKGLRVVPACSYVATFIQRHAEYQPLVS